MTGQFLVALSLALLANAPAANGAEDVSLAPRAGVLLLTNGEVIQGTITAAGDRYDVVGPDSEVRVRRSDVELVCPDVRGCYLHKRRGIEQGRAADHLNLAEWCLKNGLIEPAEQELQAARAADPNHPRIRLLEPRLRLAKQAPERAESPTAPPRALSGVQLDGIVRNLPAGSMENFTNTIQPMLLNYCAKSGCHGPRSSGALKLERIGPSRLAGRHATQGNLQAVLTMINRGDPQESKLLAAPIRPHGTLKVPVFTDREHSQYKQLVQWVLHVSQVKEAPAKPTLAERTAPLLQTVPRPGQSSAPDKPAESQPPKAKLRVDPNDWSQSFPDQAGAAAERAGHPEQATPKAAGADAGRQVVPGESDADFVPRDPFDPEIFNRRFFGR
jgi:hypothetical protein